jgi:hypothetical protein
MAGCNDQAVRNVLQEFARDELATCLTRGSRRPHIPSQRANKVA